MRRTKHLRAACSKKAAVRLATAASLTTQCIATHSVTKDANTTAQRSTLCPDVRRGKVGAQLQGVRLQWIQNIACATLTVMTGARRPTCLIELKAERRTQNAFCVTDFFLLLYDATGSITNTNMRIYGVSEKARVASDNLDT